MKKAIVCGDASGNVVVPSKNNPNYGHIRVEQERMVIDDNGFARNIVISALIPGLIKDLKSFGFVKGQQLDGKVIFKEQLTPFNNREPERDYKIAGKSGVICTIEGQPIYRKNFYSPNAGVEDVYIRDEETGEIKSHDNKDEIKAAYEALEETADAAAEEITDDSLESL